MSLILLLLHPQGYWSILPYNLSLQAFPGFHNFENQEKSHHL